MGVDLKWNRQKKSEKSVFFFMQIEKLPDILGELSYDCANGRCYSLSHQTRPYSLSKAPKPGSCSISSKRLISLA